MKKERNGNIRKRGVKHLVAFLNRVPGVQFTSQSLIRRKTVAISKRRIDSGTQTIGELLRKPFSYAVPVYQRDFAWTSEEVDILWDDLSSSLQQGRNEYFLGAIVISSATEEKKREIIDGQQRLALLSMIFSAISSLWRANADEKRSTGVFRDYLGSEDRRTGDILPKISLNENNNETYQSIVLKNKIIPPKEIKLLSYSNKLLAEAHGRIFDKVKNWTEQFKDKEAALIDLEEFISEKTNTIVIEAGDESDAFVIFETLNDRGLELAVSDLVKNYLFSLAGPHHIERFKKIWTEISVLVSAENLTSVMSRN